MRKNRKTDFKDTMIGGYAGDGEVHPDYDPDKIKPKSIFSKPVTLGLSLFTASSMILGFKACHKNESHADAVRESQKIEAESRSR